MLSHEFSEEFDMGITWVYGTGNAITFPQATYWSHEEDINYGPGGEVHQDLIMITMRLNIMVSAMEPEWMPTTA